MARLAHAAEGMADRATIGDNVAGAADGEGNAEGAAGEVTEVSQMLLLLKAFVGHAADGDAREKPLLTALQGAAPAAAGEADADRSNNCEGRSCTTAHAACTQDERPLLRRATCRSEERSRCHSAARSGSSSGGRSGRRPLEQLQKAQLVLRRPKCLECVLRQVAEPHVCGFTSRRPRRSARRRCTWRTRRRQRERRRAR